MKKVKINYLKLKKFMKRDKSSKFSLIKKDYNLKVIAFKNYKGNGITFCQNLLNKKLNLNTKSILIGNLKDKSKYKKGNFILVKNPKFTFIQIINMFTIPIKNKIHSTAIINPKAKIGKNVSIGAYSVIEDCKIGNNTVIGSFCSIAKNSILKNNVKIGDLSCIGNEGMNFKTHKNKILHFKHLSNLIIYDNVWIGTNTNINRGVLTPTKIMKNTCIGSKCEIGHNVKISENCTINSGSVIGGSSTIGKRTKIGCNAFIKEGITISQKTYIGAGVSVMRDIKVSQQVVIPQESRQIRNYFDKY